MARWPDSEEPFHTGYALAHYPAAANQNAENADSANTKNNNITLSEFLAFHPYRASRFAAGMRLYAKRPGLAVRHTVEVWKEGWEGLLPVKGGGGAMVVDVGGSHGEVAILLAETFPALWMKEVIVQDIDKGMVHSAGENLVGEFKLKGEGDELRVRYMFHDFFET